MTEGNGNGQGLRVSTTEGPEHYAPRSLRERSRTVQHTTRDRVEHSLSEGFTAISRYVKAEAERIRVHNRQEWERTDALIMKFIDTFEQVADDMDAKVDGYLSMNRKISDSLDNLAGLVHPDKQE